MPKVSSQIQLKQILNRGKNNTSGGTKTILGIHYLKTEIPLYESDHHLQVVGGADGGDLAQGLHLERKK